MASILSVLALALQAVAAGEVIVFDCVGTSRQGPAHAVGEAAPWRDRFTVDLAARRYCREACAEWFVIGAVDEHRLVLVSRPSGELAIDRASCRLAMNMSYGDLVVIREARCTAAPAQG